MCLFTNVPSLPIEHCFGNVDIPTIHLKPRLNNDKHQHQQKLDAQVL